MSTNMFRKLKVSGATSLNFITIIKDVSKSIGILTVREKVIEIYSKPYNSKKAIKEYSKSYPINYPSLDWKIKVIKDIIEENYYSFNARFFSNVSMFSLNGVLYKNPKMLDYSKKILEGELIEKDLYCNKGYSPKLNIDIIDNKGGIVFFYKNEIIIIHSFIGSCEYINAFMNGENLGCFIYNPNTIKDIIHNYKPKQVIKLYQSPDGKFNYQELL